MPAPNHNIGATYMMPDNYDNLNELEAPPPVENPHEEGLYRHHSLEEYRSGEQQTQNQDLPINHNNNAVEETRSSDHRRLCFGIWKCFGRRF